ncbi:DUF2474 domain-containing protein [Serratia plymuthica]|jgi:hypothetical protein|nr:DUF2474 domain-containing protein [Serratia plymuthica]NIC28610.1 DUF2474 domain-containing protein [Serratia plymuthica]UNK29458.1 DUF2474 domain-containing protein [Serratia plymuthica]
MKPVTDSHPALWRRLMWMMAIWAASVLALGVVASVFKLLMVAAGMKSH